MAQAADDLRDDLFHEEVADEFIEAVFDTMRRAGRHTFQVVARRADRMRDFVEKRASEGLAPNVAQWVSSRPRAGSPVLFLAMPAPDPGDPLRVSLLSLGCPKNLVDSERMLFACADSDLVICPHPEDAEVVVVNTCGFLQPAVTESIDTIREMIRLKETGEVRAVVVTGCLAERDEVDILAETPGVDAVVPFADYDRLVGICREAIGKGRAASGPGDYRRDLLTRGERILLTPPGSAYLKISEGCDSRCSFCTIPALRGPLVSRPPEALEREAKALARSGVRELVLIGQDTTHYGFDLGGELLLARLLQRLARVPGIEWVRVLYAFPAHVTDDFLDVLAGEPTVLPYLDLPLQHISDRMLRAMRRPLSSAGTRRLLLRIRERVPGIVLRTTLIVGAPGEGEKEFRELHDFVAGTRFERLGVFTYSRERDTPMGRRDDQVPEAVKEERLDAIMRLQQSIAFANCRAQVGKTLACLVEEAPRDGAAVGRTWRDAPEIDGAITIANAPAVGALGEVRVTAAQGYDLEGRWIG